MSRIMVSFDEEEFYKMLPKETQNILSKKDVKNISAYEKYSTLEDFNSWRICSTFNEIFSKYSFHILGYLANNSFAKELPLSTKLFVYLLVTTYKTGNIPQEIEYNLLDVFDNDLRIGCFELEDKIYIKVPFNYYIDECLFTSRLI